MNKINNFHIFSVLFGCSALLVWLPRLMNIQISYSSSGVSLPRSPEVIPQLFEIPLSVSIILFLLLGYAIYKMVWECCSAVLPIFAITSLLLLAQEGMNIRFYDRFAIFCAMSVFIAEKLKHENDFWHKTLPSLIPFLVYFSTGLHKIFFNLEDWWSGVSFAFNILEPTVGNDTLTQWIANNQTLSSIGGKVTLFSECLIIFTLLFKRTRLLGVIFFTIFHAMISLLFVSNGIGLYSLGMLSYLLSQEQVNRLIQLFNRQKRVLTVVGFLLMVVYLTPTIRFYILFGNRYS